MNFYSNNQIVYNYYDTTVYKNQYQSTFQNGGYLQSSFIHPKGISHPPLSILQNGKKIEYQTEKISLFSTNNCQIIEDVIPKKESGLLDSILSDSSFAKHLEKYGLNRKEIHSWLVIQHVPITNSVTNLYVILLLQTNSTSTRVGVLPDSLDQWILQSENNESTLTWTSQFMNYGSVSININDYLTEYSNHIAEKQYHLCENENVIFIKKPVLCSFVPLLPNQPNKIIEGLNNYNIVGSNTNPSNNITLSEDQIKLYSLNKSDYKMVCDDYTPDSTNFYYYANKKGFSSPFLMAFFWIFILFVCFHFLIIVFKLKEPLTLDNSDDINIRRTFYNILYVIFVFSFIILFIVLLRRYPQNFNYSDIFIPILLFFLVFWFILQLFCYFYKMIIDMNKYTRDVFILIIILTSIWITFMVCGFYSIEFLKFNDNPQINHTYYTIISIYYFMSIFILNSILSMSTVQAKQT